MESEMIEFTAPNGRQCDVGFVTPEVDELRGREPATLFISGPQALKLTIKYFDPPGIDKQDIEPVKTALKESVSLPSYHGIPCNIYSHEEHAEMCNEALARICNADFRQIEYGPFQTLKHFAEKHCGVKFTIRPHKEPSFSAIMKGEFRLLR